ncbi:MAG: MBL fold metallo-hydrolase [Anaerolineae bacterium]|nr:MBL fold metallo-hydrolase [Anaerolineae bacterium]
MKPIVQDVYLLDGLRMGNVYLLLSDGGLTLVDAAMAGDGARIVAQIEGSGYDPASLRSVVVTHAHPDHVGGLPELVRRFDPEVIAHRAEVPYVEGTASLPAGSALQRAAQWLGGLLPRRGSGIEVARALEEGDRLDVLGGLEALHTPGHTPGSLCLFQRERGILFCGDLLINGNPLSGRGGLRYGPWAFSVDPQQLKQSARRLLDLPIEVLCTGHGAPLMDSVREKLARLLQGG